MAFVMGWPLRNDPWLDSALEFFGELAEHIARQHPHVAEIEWEPDQLVLTLYEPERFAELLHDEIRQRAQTTLFYLSKGKKQVLKPFVGFNQQPPNQHPPLYQEEKRLAFLKRVFQPAADTSRGATGCPLCGQEFKGEAHKLTLSVYPFVTKIKSLSGIRTRWTKGALKGFVTNSPVCPSCYMLGALAWMDDALLYLCDLGGRDGTAVILLPAPPLGNLLRLRELKAYRSGLKGGERRSNVRFIRKSGEEQEVRDGRFSLLLAFLERALQNIARTLPGEDWDLFSEAKRRVSDGWLFITIPQGRLKNVVSHDLVLDEPTLRLLVKLVERGILPYAHLISEIRLADDQGRPLREPVPELHELLAEALLTDDFGRFAGVFLPKPRYGLRFPFAIEGDLKTLVELWRWSEVDPQELEVVKKAGRALAGIAAGRKQPALLYSLERVRSPSDLLEVLKEGVHRLIGLEAEEMRYISLDALEQLTELAHKTYDTRKFEDLKNTLIVFAGISYAKGVMAGSKPQGGDS
jgi:hypothetical protein